MKFKKNKELHIFGNFLEKARKKKVGYRCNFSGSNYLILDNNVIKCQVFK